jgi:hypothetical protein
MTAQPREKNGRFATKSEKPSKKGNDVLPNIIFNEDNFDLTLDAIYDDRPEFYNKDEVFDEMLQMARMSVWDRGPWYSTLGMVCNAVEFKDNHFKVTFWVLPEMIQW